MSVTRPALRYFGSKFRLAPWILKHFPDHTTYVEPFGGGGSIMLRKAPSYNDVYNDLDHVVVNFFKVLRERPSELIQAIQLTPYSREEQLESFIESDDELESARRLYVRCWQTHGGGRTSMKSGWRFEKTDRRGSRAIDDWNKTDHLQAIINRLKYVQIENDDAIRIIQRYDHPNTLFYLDPPYQAEVRSIRWRSKAYTFEINTDYHKKLGEILNNISGMAIISGKDSDLYNELYGSWDVHQKTIATDHQSITVEKLWVSPNACRRLNQGKLEL